MDNQTGDLNASISAADDDATTKNSFYYIRLVCYVLIFIVGVIGNILVCLVVCRERKMKNVTNYFIFNLAVSDLSVLLICIPFDFGEIVTGTFPYGAVMCRLIYPLQTMAATASVGTLVAISLNRFMAVVYPLRPQLQTRDAKKVIVVIWVFALALVSPYIAVLELRDDSCQEYFQEKGLKAGAYTISIFLLQYVVPLSIIGLSYIRIGRDLRRDKGSYSNDALQRDQEKEAHKVMKILTVVVIVFALLMLPNHIVFLWFDFGNGNENPHAPSIVALCQICIYANSASNPLIYNAVNEQFREGFKNYFRSWIDCILKIKGSKRRDHIQIAVDRRNGAKPIGSCTMCRASSETSLNGTLCPQRESQVNNNDRDDITQYASLDTKVISRHDSPDEYEEFLTTV